ncbi:hypothetical protein [Paenarthrobacter sp. JL.01a]|uniref:hypothetical protein n=1 Tax=Paenarthrobacter sp. JL.01a TaxID=2979324 RepID=UPI0021C8CCE1|nr:hypothetical protein [Paenarthrobacter sp. JL.01a]UXM92494.1 hypothetical protein N5P29_03990 [Paenarthrobacter sp. JL.01a]
MSFGVNEYRDNWLQAVKNDISMSSAACKVAYTIGDSMGLGRIVTSNWHRLNSYMNRSRTDRAILAGIKELQVGGYLNWYTGTEYYYSFGWRLTLPGEGL